MTAQTTKVDIWLQSKSHSVRLAPAILAGFRALAKDTNRTLSDLASEARKDHNGTLAEAITDYVLKHTSIPLHAARETWLGAVIDTMREEFKHRGYPLPEKIVAVMGFPSTGWRGKRRGECWQRRASADKATSHIFIHPCETDVERIVNILTHELCHAAQDLLAETRDKPKQAGGHGRFWTEVSKAMDITVGKGTHALGGDEWKAWALPMIEAAGPMPYAALDAYVPKEKKQTARMLKFEHTECEGVEGESYIWRASSKGITDKARVSCPCCGERIPNPHFGDGEDEEPDEVPEDQQEAKPRCRKCKKADGKPMLGDRYGQRVHHTCYAKEQNEVDDIEGEEEAQAKYDRHDYPERRGTPPAKRRRPSGAAPSMTEHTAKLYWPNDEGYTPCSALYKRLTDERDAIKAPGESLEDLTPEQYEAWNRLDNKLNELQAAGGHLGKSVRY